MSKKLLKYDIEIPGIILGAMVIGMVISVAVKGQSIEYVLTAGLIAVTTWYAYATIKIAKASKQQADASVKMAEAMEKSITETVRPMVHPSVAFGQDASSNQMVMYASFKNIGRGPALHVEANIRHPHFEFKGPLPETVLEVGRGVQLNIPSAGGEQKSQEDFELIAKYQDIYGKWFHSKLTQDEHGQYHYTELEGKGDD